MPDQNNPPTAKDIEDTTTRYLDHHGEIRAGELVSQVVTLVELMHHDGDGTPSVRRVTITDAMAHPGALESLVRHTADDLSAGMHTGRQDSSRIVERHAG